MGWKDKLRPASFRGVPFKIRGHDADTAGREVQVHEYPGRDAPYPEDMRRKTKTYNVDAYVIGQDYMNARDRLIDACDRKGAGTLVHPYLGSLSVICQGCKLSETADEGGMARFQLSFIESGSNQFPKTSTDHAFAINQAADEAHAALRSGFADKFTVADKPAFLANEASGIVSSASDEIAGAADDTASSTFIRAVKRVGSEALKLVQNPSGLADQLGGLVVEAGQYGGLTGNSLTGLRALTKFGVGFARVPLTTATRKVQAVNQNALVSLVTNSAVIEMARNVVETDFTTTDDAFGTRDEISGLLDNSIDTASEDGDDALYDKLRTLRTAATGYINSVSPRTAQVINTVAPLTEPALVTAYRYYQDAGKADEIAERNGIAHPGFVPGGEQIEVLSNV